MDTPDDLRRLAESKALVESLQTMKYLTEFPSLEERRDFRKFPLDIEIHITIHGD